VIDDLLAFLVRPDQVLAVVGIKLPAALLFRLPGHMTVMVELFLSPLARLLVLPAGRRAQRSQSCRRLDLVSATIWHHDRHGQWPGIERRNPDLLRQLLQAKRARRQDGAQEAAQLGDLRIQFMGPGGGISVAPMLISTQRLALITSVGPHRGTPGSFLFLLRSLPGSFLGITLALLTTLSLSPGS
jgi:hypothetical protein